MMIERLFGHDGVDGDRRGVLQGVVAIVAVGVALGLAYNAVGLASEPSFGLAWIAKSPEDDVFVMGEDDGVGEGAAAAGEEPEYIDTDDPLAIMLSAPAADPQLSPIPDIPRPIQMQLPVVKKYFDAGAALFVDAREPDEYLEGHVPGALNLPFDTAVTDPALLETLPTEGRPVIVYCGGGGCEVSISLAWELIHVGHSRVTYFQGGFPEWEQSGYPVERGAGEGS